jgi:hypothetical protein
LVVQVAIYCRGYMGFGIDNHRRSR